MYPDWSNIVIKIKGDNKVVIENRNDADDEAAPPAESSAHNVFLHSRTSEENQV